jgi:DNA-binding MarR family transcriptional regulator
MTTPGIDLREYRLTGTVLFRLAQLAKVHRSALARELSKLGMYIGQEQVLLHLWEPDGASQAELGARVQASPPTLTKMLQRMERAGLVRRERDAGRGRASWVFLTERGRELRGEVETLWRHAEDELTATLTASQRSLLCELLDKLEDPDSARDAADFEPADGDDEDD